MTDWQHGWAGRSIVTTSCQLCARKADRHQFSQKCNPLFQQDNEEIREACEACLVGLRKCSSAQTHNRRTTHSRHDASGRLYPYLHSESMLNLVRHAGRGSFSSTAYRISTATTTYPGNATRNVRLAGTEKRKKPSKRSTPVLQSSRESIPRSVEGASVLVLRVNREQACFSL